MYGYGTTSRLFGENSLLSRNIKSIWSKCYRVFQGSFKGVSRKLQERFKEVSGKFQGSFKKVLRVFQVRLKGVSSNFDGVSRVFEESFKCIKEVSMVPPPPPPPPPPTPPPPHALLHCNSCSVNIYK